MRILKRIIYAPTYLNRAAVSTKVIPEYPDVSHYESRLCGIADYSQYYEVANAQKYKTPKHIRNSYLLPKEIGYLIEHRGKLYGVPLHKLKKFMHAMQVTETEHNKGDLYAVYTDTLEIHNNDPCTEDGEVVFLYYTDTTKQEVCRLPIDISFRVYTNDKSVKTIYVKGDATVPGLKLLNEALLPVNKGEIVDVDWVILHNGERIGSKCD